MFHKQPQKVPKTAKFKKIFIFLKNHLHVYFKMKPQGTYDD